jgi:uncharacterized protein YjbJ (UPF0337 family)
MGLLDKLLGRGKKAAGDVAGDASLATEGAHQEAQAEAEERAGELEDQAQAERAEAARHEAERQVDNP